MIYELRIYDCNPGKLPNLLKRFEEHTLKLWEQHGIRQAGFLHHGHRPVEPPPDVFAGLGKPR